MPAGCHEPVSWLRGSQTREEGGAKCKQSTFSLAKTRHKRHHGEKETEFLDVLVMTVFRGFFPCKFSSFFFKNRTFDSGFIK